MKYVLTPIAALTAMPALAHSGAHLHPHGAESWLAVVLAASVLAGTAAMVLVRARSRKGPRR